METMAITQGLVHGTYQGWGGPPGPLIFFPFLFSTLFLALLAWVAFRLLSRWRDGEGLWPHGDRAEEILRQRFARGEMTDESTRGLWKPFARMSPAATRTTCGRQRSGRTRIAGLTRRNGQIVRLGGGNPR